MVGVCGQGRGSGGHVVAMERLERAEQRRVHIGCNHTPLVAGVMVMVMVMQEGCAWAARYG